MAAEIAGDFVVINDDLAEALLDTAKDSRKSKELHRKKVISFNAAVNIGHHEAIGVLDELLDHSSDDDIIEAVHEALAMLDELF